MARLHFCLLIHSCSWQCSPSSKDAHGRVGLLIPCLWNT